MSESDTSTPRSRGAYAKSEARKQAILDSAIAVFASRGAGRTSLRAIAQEVGVTHAALTHHFGSLEHLLVEVYRESVRQLDRQQPNPPDASPVELMRVASQRNHGVPGLVQLYTSLVAAALEVDRPTATEFATGRYRDLRRKMAELVRVHQARGDIRPDLDPALVAALVIAASDGLQTQWLLDERVDQDGALTMLERLLAVPEPSPDA